MYTTYAEITYIRYNQGQQIGKTNDLIDFTGLSKYRSPIS